MFQSLNIFKNAAVSVQQVASGSLAASAPTPDADTMPRGTVETIKSVKGPTREELEADFAFITDVLTKAGPEVAPMPSRQPATRVMDSSVTRVLETKVPSFTPQHLRTKALNGDQPVFAVQSTARPSRPDFLRETAAEQVDLEPSSSAPATEQPEEAIEMQHDTLPQRRAVGTTIVIPEPDTQVAEEREQTQAPVIAKSAPRHRARKNGSRLLESLPVEDVALTLPTDPVSHEQARADGQVSRVPRSNPLSVLFDYVAPEEPVQIKTDAYDFGPEIPRALRYLLNAFMSSPNETDGLTVH